MFISKLRYPERKENSSLTSKCRFKTFKIHRNGFRKPCEFHSCYLGTATCGCAEIINCKPVRM